MKQILLVLSGIGIVAFIAVACLFGLFFYLSSGHIVIKNETAETINQCSVELPGNKKTFENIGPTAERDLWFSPTHDGEYHVTVTLSSGRKLVDDLGYVTPNLGNRDCLVISPDQITLVQDKFPSLAGKAKPLR
ncbi:MAG: hypothetical protein DKT66_07925 [Candidatus Melainabacteria bacterium]|nr:MAG: hypothetical protein DKT66_07925 [Candidatus Melainabacteria bacterium]